MFEHYEGALLPDYVSRDVIYLTRAILSRGGSDFRSDQRTPFAFSSRKCLRPKSKALGISKHIHPVLR